MRCQVRYGSLLILTELAFKFYSYLLSMIGFVLNTATYFVVF